MFGAYTHAWYLEIVLRLFNLSALIVLLILGALTIRTLTRSKGVYNKRLLPFAYYSIFAWAIWLLQAVKSILRLRDFEWFWQIDPVLTVVLSYLQVFCIVFALAALFSRTIKPQWFLPGVWLGINLFVSFLFIAHELHVDVRDTMYWLDLCLALAILAMIPAFVRLRIAPWFSVPFAVYGSAILLAVYSDYAWLEFWLWFFPLMRIVLLATWIRAIHLLLSRGEDSFNDSMNTIADLQQLPSFRHRLEVMISSTVIDLAQEREAADRAIGSLYLERFRAESFGAVGHTPRHVCVSMARDCDLFVLIIGERYGHILQPENISVVELEYRTAREQNRNKILVYVKSVADRESRLVSFLESIQNFEDGYFRSTFKTPEELYELIQRDIARWLSMQARPRRVSHASA